jgi:hypothetical protein
MTLYFRLSPLFQSCLCVDNTFKWQFGFFSISSGVSQTSLFTKQSYL